MQITPISWIPIKMMMTLPIDICIKGNTRLKDAYLLVSWRLGSNISCRQLNNKCSILFLFLFFYKTGKKSCKVIWDLNFASIAFVKWNVDHIAKGKIIFIWWWLYVIERMMIILPICPQAISSDDGTGHTYSSSQVYM